MRTRLALAPLLALAVVAAAPAALAADPVPLTALDAPVTEDFSALAATGSTGDTLPSGWVFLETGTGANATYGVGTGSSNSGNTYSFGAADAADRAFGSLLSGSVATRIGAAFVNDTGATITSVDVSYTGEMWRLGATGREDHYTVEYLVGATGLDDTGAWSGATALDFSTDALPCTVDAACGTAGPKDGNAAAFRVAIAGTIDGLTLAPGETLWLRWTDFNASSSDDGLAIDDFSLTPRGGPVAEPDGFSLRRSLVVAGSYGVAGNVFLDCTLSPCPLGNNGTPFGYVDVDPVAIGDLDGDGADDTRGATAATLALPAGARPLAAYVLVTVSGTTVDNAGGWAAELPDDNVTIHFKAPEEAAYAELRPSHLRRTSDGATYQALFDVSDRVAGGGEFWVADAPIFPAAQSYNAVGNWVLVVVYEQDGAPLKLINLYDGLESCFRSSFDLTLDGFVTPATGTVTGQMTIVAGDGSAPNPGDSVTLNGDFPLSNPANPSNNIGNNTVSGVDGLPFPRNPDTFNVTDELLDLDTFTIDGAFGNGASGGGATFTCADDGVLWTGVVLAFDVRAPSVTVVKSVASEAGEGPIGPSSVVVYQLDVETAVDSPDDALGVTLVDPLPAELSPADGEILVFQGDVLRSYTVAADDDAGEVVDGVLTVELGDMPAGSSRVVQIRLRVDDGVADGVVTNVAQATFGGQAIPSGAVVVSNEASFDAVSCVNEPFGQIPLCGGSVQSFVWYDLDEDGIADPGEPGLQGWDLTLDDPATAGVDHNATSDVNGAALFEDVAPATYAIGVTPPEGQTHWTWVVDDNVTAGSGGSAAFTVGARCTCDDEDPCTVDTCELDGTCRFELLATDAPDDDCDGVDDDCDGQTDEGYQSVADSCGLGVCAGAGVTSCVDGEVLSTCEIGEPTGDDTDCDGVDQDCDGVADDGFVGQGVTCGLGVCAAEGVTVCVGGEVGEDCTPGEATGDDTDCDGVDDDCDGFPDDGFTPETFACGDAQCGGTGTRTCVGGELVAGACTPRVDGTLCEAPGACALAAACAAGRCEATTFRSCNDGNPCTEDACDFELGCVSSPVEDGTACDDGDLCTTASACAEGACVGSAPVSCGSPGACELAGTCNPATGICDFPMIPGCVDCGEDTTPPAIVCPAVVTAECVAGGVEVALGAPSASDACGSPAVTSDAPATFDAGFTEVVFTATDGADNNATCTTGVDVVDTQPPTIACPEATTVAGQAGICGAQVTLTPTATDGCDGDDVTIIGPAADAVYLPGETSVTLAAVDAAGNVATCTTRVVVTGLDGFDISCDADLTVAAPEDACGWPEALEATLVDECRGETTLTSESGGFPVGDTLVSFAATRDGDGATASCTTRLTVEDVTAPAVSCGGDDASDLQLPTTITPTATDACGVTLSVEDAACERVIAGAPAAVAERCEVSVAGGVVVVGDAPALSGGTVRVTYTLRATDPSGNESVVDCVVGVDPESLDHDGDGVIDRDDNCPEVANAAQGDADGDGLGD
ncbi:MAG: HYR domain-containing protein, partial [Myxococcales bacterium]|nr:HYR domain-containing protein [Myxococcales bacterium]